MKKILTAVALASVVACVFCAARKVNEGRLNVTGTITVPERLAKVAEADNNSCAIIVKNAADGKIVTDSAAVRTGARLIITPAKGSISASVLSQSRERFPQH